MADLGDESVAVAARPSELWPDPSQPDRRVARRERILFVVNSLEVGGAEKHTIALLNSIDPQHFAPSLAYLKSGAPLLSSLRADRLESVLCCEAQSGIDLKSVRRLAAFITATEADTVVCTNTYATLYGYLARRIVKRDVKLVSVYHTTVLRTAKERIQHRLYRWAVRRCDLLVFVCERQKEYWTARQLRANRQTVIHNGIDVAFFRDNYSVAEKSELRRRVGFSAEDFVIGLCAAFRPEKAHADLLEAIAKLRALGLPAKALLIGEGPERPRIEALIGTLGLQSHVHMTGLQADVRPWIACADVMTVVSRSIETFSLAGLESMALGKPLVMSDIGGADEEVVPGETGYLFPPGDVDALVSCLRKLGSSETRARMGQAGLRRVHEMFTLERMTSGFEQELLRLKREDSPQPVAGTA